MSFRQNIVILLPHGLRSDALSDSQAWPLQTPAMEKLAQRGLRAVASSACPADWGGMLSLFTGQHARQHGYLDQTRGPVPCQGWPAALHDGGYHTAGVGLVGGHEAWFDRCVVVDDPDQTDVSRCGYLTHARERGMLAAVEQQRRQRRRSGPFEPDRLLLEPDDDIDGYIAREAKRLLAEMPTDKPWALVVAFSGPGNDLPPPPLYQDLVDRKELTAGFVPADFRNIDARAELDYPRSMLQRLEPHAVAGIRADYLGRVALIDHGVGMLTAAVDSRADRGRTWFVLSSDRGHLLGDRGLIGHRSFLCGAVEVPVIIAAPPGAPLAPGPDAAGGHFFDGLVSTVDVAATIAALGGCDRPASSIGRSLLATLGDSPALPPLPGGSISEFGRRLMLETERYKIVFDTETQRPLALFDLLNDPDEATDILTSPIGSNLIDSMRWRLAEALLPLRAAPAGTIG